MSDSNDRFVEDLWWMANDKEKARIKDGFQDSRSDK